MVDECTTVSVTDQGFIGTTVPRLYNVEGVVDDFGALPRDAWEGDALD